MIRSILLATFLFSNAVTVPNALGQRHDSLSGVVVMYDGYKGTIADSSSAPYGSRNVFPKNRFTPTIDEIERFESQLLKQYSSAVEKHHYLFYELYLEKYRDDYDDEEWASIEEYRDVGPLRGREGADRLEREHPEFDRVYYGFRGKNGLRYLQVHFLPHEKVWFDSGVGEDLLYNLPPLVYNLDTDVLSLAGWTGEGE